MAKQKTIQKPIDTKHCASCGETIIWLRNPELFDNSKNIVLAFCDQTCYDNYQSKLK